MTNISIATNLGILKKTAFNQKDINNSNNSLTPINLSSKATKRSLRTIIEERIEEDKTHRKMTHDLIIKFIRP